MYKLSGEVPFAACACALAVAPVWFWGNDPFLWVDLVSLQHNHQVTFLEAEHWRQCGACNVQHAESTSKCSADLKYHVALMRSPGVYFVSSLFAWASIKDGRLLERGVYCFQNLNLTTCNISLMQKQLLIKKKYMHLGTPFMYILGWAFIREGHLLLSTNFLGGLLLGRGVY